MSTDPFRTITGDDWKRELARARSETNTVTAQLLAAVAALPKGKP